MKAPILHRALARDFKTYCDFDNVIPYSKVKFCLTFKFRVPKDKLISILKEFESYGILIRIDRRYFKLCSELFPVPSS